MKKLCVKVWVSGRVQGVFFRGSTRQQANRLGLTGHAINLSDGRVEVLACGDKDDLDEFIQWLRVGPRMADVSKLDFETVIMLAPDYFEIG